MHVIQIRPHTVHHNTDTNQRVSIFGAVPWFGDKPACWTIKQFGFSLLLDNNTTINGGDTEADAISKATKINNKRRMQLAQHAEWYPDTEKSCAMMSDVIPTF